MSAHDLPDRETMECDVVIVGAGPAGLAAAIRLKQIDPALSIIVLEKGSEVGAHILSGAVVDPTGINQLLPGWLQDESHPLRTPVTDDHFCYLTAKKAYNISQKLFPNLLSNEGNYVVSLGLVCRWLAKKAEALGVDIFPGFAVTEVLFGKHNEVIGVATGDMGVKKDGKPGRNFIRGIELKAKYVLVGEGARGSLTKKLIGHYQLNQNCAPQKYGLGIKELWEIDPKYHKAGSVTHSVGWPLNYQTGGGGFIYHMQSNLVSVGFVTHLDYKNPYLSPFHEFQRFKAHPAWRNLFKGAKRICYGARTISEGGWQSVPKLTFPGGALIGCAAGFVNLPRLKGSHNAVLSGMNTAKYIAQALAAGRSHDEVVEIEDSWRSSAIGQDLYPVRNVKPLLSKLGSTIGLPLSYIELWCQSVLKFSIFGTLKHSKPDCESLQPASKHRRIRYPKPDDDITFDILSSVFLTNTHYEDDQPCHLKVKSLEVQDQSERAVFAGPSTRYCPAGVYEWVEQDGRDTYIINAQNCIHCKTCDIKDPNGNIDWECPQGGDGPNYANM